MTHDSYSPHPAIIWCNTRGCGWWGPVWNLIKDNQCPLCYSKLFISPKKRKYLKKAGVDEIRCIEIMRNMLDEHRIYNSMNFAEAREKNIIPEGLNRQAVTRALRYGVKKGWIKAYWTGTGPIPYSESPRRTRVYELTGHGIQVVKK